MGDVGQVLERATKPVEPGHDQGVAHAQDVQRLWRDSSELPASTTSLGLLATPVISILVALFLLGEQPTLILMIALALILADMAVGMSGPAASAPRR